jgi:RHH-type proline utilization regulon transcriptional repressor/proline dehydrogenase/delta 1-pyrroline-5-carboxylate dehydrogenase
MQSDLAAVSVVLWEGVPEDLLPLQKSIADRVGPIVLIYTRRDDPQTGEQWFSVEWLVHERSTSTNTSAAGGNASLMAVS